MSCRTPLRGSRYNLGLLSMVGVVPHPRSKLVDHAIIDAIELSSMGHKYLILSLLIFLFAYYQSMWSLISRVFLFASNCLTSPAELLSFSSSAQVPIYTPQGSVVTITNGSYSGVYNPTYKQDFFLGVPYAQVRHPFMSSDHMLRDSSHRSTTCGSVSQGL